MPHQLKIDTHTIGQLTGGRGFSELDVLKGILAASNDACWCMEFSSPVDLTAPDDEVVRQIFGNHPVWRLCNPAMERLYQLPLGENLNAHEVREIFPDNHSNREFVRNLIANGFEVDAAPALDTRYHGQQIYVENDVRAHISDGKLFRMFGTVRNVDKHRRREHACIDLAEAARHPLRLQLPPIDVPGAEAVTAAASAIYDLRSEVRRYERILIDRAIRPHGSKRKAANAPEQLQAIGSAHGLNEKEFS